MKRVHASPSVSGFGQSRAGPYTDRNPGFRGLGSKHSARTPRRVRVRTASTPVWNAPAITAGGQRPSARDGFLPGGSGLGSRMRHRLAPRRQDVEMELLVGAGHVIDRKPLGDPLRRRIIESLSRARIGGQHRNCGGPDYPEAPRHNQKIDILPVIARLALHRTPRVSPARFQTVANSCIIGRSLMKMQSRVGSNPPRLA